MTTAIFTRASVAHKQDGSQVTSGFPRYEAGKFGKAITVEESRTNLFSYSDLSNIPNQTVADASLIKMGFIMCGAALNGVRLVQNAITTFPNISVGVGSLPISGYQYTLSAYVRSSTAGIPVKAVVYCVVSGTTYYLSGDKLSWTTTATEVVLFTDTVVPNNSYRLFFIMPVIPAGTLTTFAINSIYRTQSNFTLDMAGFQIERGLYPTSLIQTSGDAITRATEYCQIATAGLLSVSAGTVCAWAKAFMNTKTVQMPFNAWPFFYVSMLSDNSRRVVLSWMDSTNTQQVAYSTLIIDQTIWHHWAVTWGGGVIRAYVDGILFCESSPTTFRPALSAYLDMGTTLNMMYPWNGLIDDLRIFSRALSAAEIQAVFKREVA